MKGHSEENISTGFKFSGSFPLNLVYVLGFNKNNALILDGVNRAFKEVSWNSHFCSI